MILKFILLGALFILAAFFSGAETAITSINRLRLRELMRRKNSAQGREKQEFEWAADYNHLLTTILVGVTIVEMTASIMGAAITIEIFHSRMLGFYSGVMIFFILIFGEIIPKIYSKRHAESLAALVIPPLRFFDILLYPVTKALVLIANILIRIFGGMKVDSVPFVTEKELKLFVDIGEREGVFESDEGRMIHSVFDFGDKNVVQVMKPREEVYAIKEGMLLKDILTLAVVSGYSRLPVYRDTVEHVVGVIYTKDLLNLWKNGELINMQDIIREPYFVLESMKVKDLLKQFQKRRIHIGIVVDEENRTRGIVTLEDLVEEIVGEIRDEYDTE